MILQLVWLRPWYPNSPPTPTLHPPGSPPQPPPAQQLPPLPQDADQQVHPTGSWPDRLSRLGYKLFPASPPPPPSSQPPTHPFPAVPRSSVATPSVPHRSQYGGHWLAYSKALLHTRSWREGGGSWWGGGGGGAVSSV